MAAFTGIHPVTLHGTVTAAGQPVAGTVVVSVGELTQDVTGRRMIVTQPDEVALTAGAFTAVVPGRDSPPAPLVEVAVVPADGGRTVFQFPVVTAVAEMDWEGEV